MNSGGDTGESSAQYAEYNHSRGSVLYQNSTSLSYVNPLRLPLLQSPYDGYTIDQTNPGLTLLNCSNGTQAGQGYRSYLGPWDYSSGGRYKGLMALVTFNYDSSYITGNSGDASGLEQAVYFHEHQCYDGGREYGVVLDARTNALYFYWLTDANGTCGADCVQHFILNDGSHAMSSFIGQQLNYQIYPVTYGSSCAFVTSVFGPAPNCTTVYASTTTQVQSSIITNDSGFCSGVLGEQGYVTAATKIVSTIDYTDSSAAYNAYNLNISGIWIGK
jgi:hypothetical protein